MQGFHQVTQTSVISRELILPTVLATRDTACYFGSHLSSLLVLLCQLAEGYACGARVCVSPQAGGWMY